MLGACGRAAQGASKQLREGSETGRFRLTPAAVSGALFGCFRLPWGCLAGPWRVPPGTSRCWFCCFPGPRLSPRSLEGPWVGLLVGWLQRPGGRAGPSLVCHRMSVLHCLLGMIMRTCRAAFVAAALVVWKGIRVSSVLGCQGASRVTSTLDPNQNTHTPKQKH